MMRPRKINPDRAAQKAGSGSLNRAEVAACQPSAPDASGELRSAPPLGGCAVGQGAGPRPQHPGADVRMHDTAHRRQRGQRLRACHEGGKRGRVAQLFRSRGGGGGKGGLAPTLWRDGVTLCPPPTALQLGASPEIASQPLFQTLVTVVKPHTTSTRWARRAVCIVVQCARSIDTRPCGFVASADPGPPPRAAEAIPQVEGEGCIALEGGDPPPPSRAPSYSPNGMCWIQWYL